MSRNETKDMFMLFLFHQVLWKNINELLLLKFTVPQKCKNYM